MELLVEPYDAVFATYLAISFSFKLCDVGHLIIRQSTVDIFLVDWERPDVRPHSDTAAS